VETFYEWVIDRTPFGGSAPVIPGATFVDELSPYIERKLFTVNTGHASAAYFGFEAGLEKISDAMADQDVAADVRAVLEETKQLLVQARLQQRRAGSLRPEDPGPLLQPAPAGHREPGGPGAAAEAQPARAVHRAGCRAGRTRMVPEALLGAIAAALRFNDPADAEATELAGILASSSPADATRKSPAWSRNTRCLTPSTLVEERQAEVARTPARGRPIIPTPNTCR
jgi:mannitol-1-phosphate 5-dehydrogenase